jgi:hypothetical protein
MSLAAWSLVVAILAMLVSGGSVWYSRRLVQVEHARDAAVRRTQASASLRAFVGRVGTERHELRVENIGHAPARTVLVTVNGLSAATSPHVWPADRSLIPAAVLAPGGGLALGLLTYDGHPGALSVVLTWTDDSGPDLRRWESLVPWS